MWSIILNSFVHITEEKHSDDWETDPDYVNNITEEQQRWGTKDVYGRTAGAIDMEQLRLTAVQEDAEFKKEQMQKNRGSSFGYGGKFGIEADRMDKAAVGNDYKQKLEKHPSQKDYSEGFGGKFGVQSNRVDKNAVGWDHIEKIEKHASQKDYSTGFGGKFGIEKNKQDHCAVGWDYKEKIEKHCSQLDYKQGFGGKFGIQKDRQDKCAVGWDHQEQVEKHSSQRDHSLGFGGKFGIQKDRQDQTAVGWEYETPLIKHSSQEDNYTIGCSEKFEPKKNDQDLWKNENLSCNQSVSGDNNNMVNIQVNDKKTTGEIKMMFEQMNKTMNMTTYPSYNNEEIKEENLKQIHENNLQAVALYDYQATDDDEISFDPDDIITGVEMIDKGWWRGTCHGVTGLFPANYVQLIK